MSYNQCESTDDYTKIVNGFKDAREKLANNVISEINRILPDGYTFKKAGQHVSITKTITQQSHRWVPFSDSLVYKISDDVTITNKATPEDVYKLSMILQFMASSVALSSLDDVDIVK